MRKLKTFFPLLLLSTLLLTCTGKKSRLDDFASAQEKKEKTKTVYNQAELDFWASIYEPTTEDLLGIREAWVDYSQSFPESKTFLDIESEVHKTNQKVLLISLFSTNYDIADLKDKSLGWSTFPVARSISELAQDDLVLRSLMPVHNAWARYFLVRISLSEWESAPNFVLSNRTSKAVFTK